MPDVTEREQSEFVKFWNEVLVPKFNRFRHVIQGGLSKHSDAIFPKLEVHEGERVLDAGCGWGDTAIMLAGRVGPKGEVVGMDCCEAFLEIAREDAKAHGLDNLHFFAADVEIHPFAADFDLCSPASARCSSQIPLPP